MNENLPWYERDDVWSAIEPAIFSSNGIIRASEHIDGLVRLADFNQNMHILDLCCGIGRYTLELARRGFIVTGVDRNSLFLKKAMDKAKEKNLEIEFIREDMRKFRRPGQYDFVLNINTSFGYFEDPEEDKLVLRNMHDSLKEGGRLLIDMASKEIIAGIYCERDWDEFDDLILLQERKVEDNWNRMAMRWIIIRNGEIKTVNMKVRLFSAEEMRKLMMQCGFSRVDFYGSLEGIPYDHKAKRMIAIAWK